MRCYSREGVQRGGDIYPLDKEGVRPGGTRGTCQGSYKSTRLQMSTGIRDYCKGISLLHVRVVILGPNDLKEDLGGVNGTSSRKSELGGCSVRKTHAWFEKPDLRKTCK